MTNLMLSAVPLSFQVCPITPTAPHSIHPASTRHPWRKQGGTFQRGVAAAKASWMRWRAAACANRGAS